MTQPGFESAQNEYLKLKNGFSKRRFHYGPRLGEMM